MVKVTNEIQHHLTANGRLRKRDIMISNFLGGLSWGFGTVVGATVVVAILLSILQGLGYVPFIGQFANQVTNDIRPRSILNRDDDESTPKPKPTATPEPTPTPTESPSPTPSQTASGSATTR